MTNRHSSRDQEQAGFKRTSTRNWCELDSQAGVNLDEEAVNLVRYQQAFQACGKAIQVASTLFDTLLAIR